MTPPIGGRRLLPGRGRRDGSPRGPSTPSRRGQPHRTSRGASSLYKGCQRLTRKAVLLAGVLVQLCRRHARAQRALLPDSQLCRVTIRGGGTLRMRLAHVPRPVNYLCRAQRALLGLSFLLNMRGSLSGRNPSIIQEMK